MLEEIARGSMGAVLRARGRRLDRALATKVILAGRDVYMGVDSSGVIYDQANRPHLIAQHGKPIWDILT